MMKLYSQFSSSLTKSFSSYSKPKLTQEETFELDPAEILVDFCQKIKSLDKDNWLINSDLGKEIFEDWFEYPLAVKFFDLTTVWNSKKIKIKLSYAIIDGFQTDIFEFFHDKERIMTLQKIKDYGKTFYHHQKKMQSVESKLKFPLDTQLAFLQNSLGEGIMLEKFGHTHRWRIENWFTVHQFVLTKIRTI